MAFVEWLAERLDPRSPKQIVTVLAAGLVVVVPLALLILWEGFRPVEFVYSLLGR